MLDYLVLYNSQSGNTKSVAAAIFSALPVGVLQGAVTLCAGLVAPVFSDGVIANLSFLGNMLIFCVGVNLCFGTKFKVANLLPALVFGPVFQWAVSFLPI